jgi:hypothetical protein
VVDTIMRISWYVLLPLFVLIEPGTTVILCSGAFALLKICIETYN